LPYYLRIAGLSCIKFARYSDYACNAYGGLAELSTDKISFASVMNDPAGVISFVF